jgi:hypothetical protein
MIRVEPFTRRDRLGRIRHYFRLVAANGEIVAQSEGYSRRIDRDRTAGLIIDGPVVRGVKP